MTARTITIEHNGTTYHGELARIDSTSFGWEDHGILTAMLHCSWVNGGVGVGGFCLDESLGKEGDYERRGTAYGLDHLMQIMSTLGVDRWEKLPGQQVIVLFEGEGAWGNRSAGIAAVLSDKVFIPAEHAQAWRDREDVSS